MSGVHGGNRRVLLLAIAMQLLMLLAGFTLVDAKNLASKQRALEDLDPEGLQSLLAKSNPVAGEPGVLATRINDVTLTWGQMAVQTDEAKMHAAKELLNGFHELDPETKEAAFIGLRMI